MAFRGPYGPRATGTPSYQQGADWVMKKFAEWGLQNIHIERFPFGQGWTIERFSAHMTRHRRPHWSASRDGIPRQRMGRCRLTSCTCRRPPRPTSKIEQGPAARQDRDQPGRPRRPHARWTGRPAHERRRLGRGDEGTGGGGRPPARPAPAAGTPAPLTPAALQRFLTAEGAAVYLDRGSDSDSPAGGSNLSWQTQVLDGGTVFPGNGGNRDPKVPAQVPSATIAVEHYNRIVRLLGRGQAVRMEVNIQTKFHAETDPAGNAFNIIADIPGTDLAKEVVIMGAHFDTYPYATGATDNTTGSSAMIEAVRVIQSAGTEAAPDHSRRAVGSRGAGPAWLARVRRTPLLRSQDQTPKPEQANVQAYFNLDNGTGRIVGIWGQGNTGAMKMFEEWGKPLKDIGWKNVSPRSVGQTDHGSFETAGIPGFQFIQERLEYNSRTHHTQHGHVRPRSEGRCDSAGGRGRGRCVVRREHNGKAAPKTVVKQVGSRGQGSVGGVDPLDSRRAIWSKWPAPVRGYGSGHQRPASALSRPTGDGDPGPFAIPISDQLPFSSHVVRPPRAPQPSPPFTERHGRSLRVETDDIQQDSFHAKARRQRRAFCFWWDHEEREGHEDGFLETGRADSGGRAGRDQQRSADGRLHERRGVGADAARPATSPSSAGRATSCG